jgi:hypothetical protein
MSDAKTYTVQGPSIGFTGLLTILFIALKLTGVINWSWIWVLSPLWIPFAIFLVIAFIAMIIMMVIALLDKR